MNNKDLSENNNCTLHTLHRTQIAGKEDFETGIINQPADAQSSLRPVS